MESLATKKKLGLVLSGGGARGFAHLGSVKALYENGYHFDIISGTSMGAILGSVLADGYQPDEIIEMLNPALLKSLLKSDISKNGMMTMKNLRLFLDRVLQVKNIEELKIPFIATATDLNHARAHYFTDGNIADAVIASGSIPVVFPPVVINKTQYVDGGVINNLPARPIRENCEKIIGLHVNPETLGLYDGEAKTLLQIAERTFHLSMLGNVLIDKDFCDVYIEYPDLYRYGMFDFKKIKEIVKVGYDRTLKVLESHSPESH